MKGVIQRLDHIGIAVRDPRERLGFWADLLGLELERAEAVPSEGVRTWFLDAGGTHLELLESLDEQGPIAKYLDKKGEGIHHLCLEVDDLDAILLRLTTRGIDPLSPGVRDGAGGCRVAFFHPKVTGGVLIELSQKPGETTSDQDLPFSPGHLVVLYLSNPRERLVGVIRSIDATGLSLEGMDLEAWDDWISQWARSEESPISPSLQYFPMSRVDKMLADQDSPSLPSFTRRFEERTGRRLAEALTGLLESSS